MLALEFLFLSVFSMLSWSSNVLAVEFLFSMRHEIVLEFVLSRFLERVLFINLKRVHSRMFSLECVLYRMCSL